jgi:hypothetical protein
MPPGTAPHHYTFIFIATDFEPKELPPGLTEVVEENRTRRQGTGAMQRLPQVSLGCPSIPGIHSRRSLGLVSEKREAVFLLALAFRECPVTCPSFSIQKCDILLLKSKKLALLHQIVPKAAATDEGRYDGLPKFEFILDGRIRNFVAVDCLTSRARPEDGTHVDTARHHGGTRSRVFAIIQFFAYR